MALMMISTSLKLQPSLKGELQRLPDSYAGSSHRLSKKELECPIYKDIVRNLPGHVPGDSGPGKVTIYGSPENIYGIVSFNINNIKPHDLAKVLQETWSICVRSGFHSAILSMNHMGAYDLCGTVRASILQYVGKIDILVEILKEVSKFLIWLIMEIKEWPKLNG